MSDIPKNTHEIDQKPEPKYAKKTLQAFKMLSVGEDPKEALKLVNGKDNITYEAAYKLKKKFMKYSLKNPLMVKLAGNQVKRILKGNPREYKEETIDKDGNVTEITKKIMPTETNILAAATMVYDRVEPVKASEGDEPEGTNYIDLTVYNIQVNQGKVSQIEGNQ